MEENRKLVAERLAEVQMTGAMMERRDRGGEIEGREKEVENGYEAYMHGIHYAQVMMVGG